MIDTLPNYLIPLNIIQILTRCHNNKKKELVECLRQYRHVLAKHNLYGTSTTGALVEKELKLHVKKFESAPLGGDRQLGAKITARELDILIFFLLILWRLILMKLM